MDRRLHRVRQVIDQLLPEGWRVRVIPGPPICWVLTSPQGQIQSVDGLHHLTESEITAKLAGLICRMKGTLT